MSKLAELKELVSKAFEGSETKESIDTLAKIQNKIDDIQKEEQDITDKNAELIKSYKDLIMHTSFKDTKAPSDDIAPRAVTFEEALQNYIAKGE